MKNAGIWVIAVLLVLVIAGQIIEIAHIRRNNEYFASLMNRRSAPTYLKAGDPVPTVKIVGTQGKAKELDLSGDQLLFVYSAHCPYCKKNMENWKQIAGNNNLRPTYLSIDSVDEASPYAKAQGIDLAVLADITDRAKLKLFSVPQTIRVHAGHVQAIYVGVLTPEQISSLLASPHS